MPRAIAMFCIALMFVFTQAAVANAINNVQHVFGFGHHHMMFSETVPEFDHHLHNGAPSDADETALNCDSTGHHHHHGDVGSSMLVLGGAASALPASLHNTRQPASDRLIVIVRHSLPERPPKATFFRA